MRAISGSRVTVIGAARSGLAAARMLARVGARVFVTDQKEIGLEAKEKLSEAGVMFEEGKHTEEAEKADWGVISPGVPSTAELPQRLVARGIALYSEIEVASWFCRGPIIGITGSNGKTTTASLLAHMFKTAGCRHTLAGNIGNAFSDYALDVEENEVVILEVSSFQLDHIERFRPKVSAVLNITPDHLDRYDNSFENYANSKFNIIRNQSASDALVFNYDDDNVRPRVAVGPGGPAKFGFSLEKELEAGAFVRQGTIMLKFNQQEEELMGSDEVILKGRHNLYNSLAAAMAARVMEIGSDAVRESLATFEGVPHRLEFVREVKGVRYVNDSKATNVNSLWYALESLSEPIVLIIGGRDKGNDYSLVRTLINKKVRAILAIGESGDRVMDELGDSVPLAARVLTLDEAVQYARVIAKPGQVVLLSPACASFDMFRNFEERGDAFKRLVAAL